MYPKRMRCVLVLDSVHSSKTHENVNHTNFLSEAQRWCEILIALGSQRKFHKDFDLGFELWLLNGNRRKRKTVMGSPAGFKLGRL